MVKQQVESQVRTFPSTHMPAHLPAYCATHAPIAVCADQGCAVHRALARTTLASTPPPTPPTLPLDFCFLAHVVRDLSHTSVCIAPADYSSWHDVRTELMSEAKSGFKARVEAELAAGTLPPPCHHPATTLPPPCHTWLPPCRTLPIFSRRREPGRAQGGLPAGGARHRARH